MKTSVIEVRDMLSVLSVLGVEQRIGKVPGVESVTVNYAAGNATVRYDETRLDVGDIMSAVRQSEYAAEGESVPGPAQQASPAAPAPTSPPPAVPKSVPDASAGAPASSAGMGHEGHAKPDAQPDKRGAASSHAGHDNHDKHEGHSPAMFRDRFWLSLALTLPVVFWSAHIQELLGYQAPEFPGSDWIGPALATVVFVYGGLVFLRGAWRELADRLPGMMTLISLAITVA